MTDKYRQQCDICQRTSGTVTLYRMLTTPHGPPEYTKRCPLHAPPHPQGTKIQ